MILEPLLDFTTIHHSELVGDHQRKEGRKEEEEEEVCVLGFVGGFISNFPSHPNGNSHKRRVIVCG